MSAGSSSSSAGNAAINGNTNIISNGNTLGNGNGDDADDDDMEDEDGGATSMNDFRNIGDSTATSTILSTSSANGHSNNGGNAIASGSLQKERSTSGGGVGINRNIIEVMPAEDNRNGPYFDKAASKNITALLGKTAYLNCRVKNLGNKTVSSTYRRKAVMTKSSAVSICNSGQIFIHLFDLLKIAYIILFTFYQF